MKNLLFLIFTFLTIQAINAQSWELDPTFGTGGIVQTEVGSAPAYGYAVAIQPNDKIVVAGQIGSSYNYQVAFVRYNANGTLDDTFGTDGEVLIAQIGSDDRILDVAIQSDGKIIATGYSKSTTEDDILVIRLHTDGTLDNTFGSDGIAVVDFAEALDYSEAIAIQPDGKILLGGYSNNDFLVVRLKVDGTLDNTFGTGGMTKTAFGYYKSGVTDIAIQSDGKIVAGGESLNSSNFKKFSVARYNTNGTPDLSFGVEGKQTYDISTAYDNLTAVCIQSDGKILLGGHKYVGFGTKYDFVVARILPNGLLDNTFGVDGFAIARLVDGTNQLKDMLLQADGKIVFAGYTVIGTVVDYGLGRFNSNGTLDNSFSPTGMINTDPFSIDDFGEAVALQSDGKIILVGHSSSSPAVRKFVVARYTCETIGVAETATGGVSIYPNPANGILNIEANSTCRIEILDMSGKTVFSAIVENQIRVDISKISSGLYFIRSCSDSKNEVIKLVVE